MRAVALVTVILVGWMPSHLALAGAVQPLAPVGDADGRLGLCDILPGTPATPGALPWGQLAANAGARFNRWEFRWDRLERARGQWNFAADDPAVDNDLHYNVHTLGILIGTPGWAAAPGNKPGNGVPAGLYRDPSDPANLWANYVRQTVQHYAGKVSAWEVWNEPDLKFFWSGTARDYFRLLKVAYLVIQTADPGALVLVAGMVVPDMTFLSHVLDLAVHDPGGKNNGGFLDALSWHIYGPAHNAYTDILRLRAIAASKGYGDAPIWVTEDGFPASNPNGEARQASYVQETVAYALAAGASEILVYRASDDPLPKTWGLTSAAGALRQGYVAFQVVAHYLAYTVAPAYSPTDHVERFSFYGSQSRVTMLWNHDVAPRPITLPAASSAATLVDWAGTATPLSADNGQYHIMLPGASYNAGIDVPGALVGAPAVFLVEDDPPVSGTPISQILPALVGAGRHATFFNDSAAPATAAVYPLDRKRRHVVLHLAPLATATVDLDLLAGTAYTGPFAVTSSRPVAARESAGAQDVAGSALSRSWSLATAPASLPLINPSSNAADVQLTLLGSRGQVRAAASLHLDPASSGQWAPPAAWQGKHLSLSIRSSQPVALGTGAVRENLARPSHQWYLIRPGSAAIRLFNPSTSSPAHIDVRFVGSPSIQGEQLTLAPRHAVSLSVHGARVLSVAADRAVSLGMRGPASVGVTPRIAFHSSLTLSGGSTGLSAFNPADSPATITVQIVNHQKTKTIPLTVRPHSVARVHVRAPSEGARGVVLTSNISVAVVASL